MVNLHVMFDEVQVDYTAYVVISVSKKSEKLEHSGDTDWLKTKWNPSMGKYYVLVYFISWEHSLHENGEFYLRSTSEICYKAQGQ